LPWFARFGYRQWHDRVLFLVMIRFRGDQAMNGTTSYPAALVLAVVVCLLANAESPDANPTSAQSPGAEKSAIAGASLQQSSGDASAAEYCQCVRRGDSAAANKIELALAGPLHPAGIDYADQPLIDVVNNLQDEYGIPIQLAKAALDEAGLSVDERVTAVIHNTSLRSALNLMLEQFQLTWIVRDEVLMITTSEEAEKHLDTCVYNVHGLVVDGDPQSMKALIDAIQDCVASETWAANGGGQAKIGPLRPGLLVVSQTPAIHEQVRGLLAAVRKMREKVPAAKPRPQEPAVQR
jgi:hypothetical protein